MAALGQGLGAAAKVLDGARGIARVFHADASQRVELDHEAHRAALAQFEAEFGRAAAHPFDHVVNGMNRLPRPLMAFGTLGLFVYAMCEPIGFAQRMEGLAYVPEPLWWLLGAIVGFYFGARELHYLRLPRFEPAEPVHSAWHHAESGGGAADDPADDNPALSAWRRDAAGG